MTQTVTTAVFRAEEEGVNETASALGRLQTAAGGAASGVDKFTKVSQDSAAKIGDVERRVDGLQRQLAGAPQAWRQYEKGMSAAALGLQAGKLNADEYASSIRQLQAQLQRVVAPRLTMDVSDSGLASLLGTTEKVTAATRQATNEMLRQAQARQQADAEVARGQALVAQETARHAAEIDALRAAYDPAYAAAQRMNREVEELARLEREGIAIAGGYGAALDRIVDKYDEAGRAARQAAQAKQIADAELARGQEMAARETARYAAEVDALRASYDPAYAAAQRLNKELDDLARLEREGIAIAGGYASALDRVVDKYDETGRAARQAAQAQADFIQQARVDHSSANDRADGQAMWNTYAGVRPSSAGSARDSAAVFEAEARSMEAMTAQAARLRAELDPMGAAYERLSAQVAGYQLLADRQLITQDELAQATARSRQTFDEFSSGLQPVNDNVKLTGNQMLNLSRQANDAFTMLASGSDVSQVLATQIGQVYGALEEGPGGLRGSLKAVGTSILGLINPTTVSIAALAAAALAVRYFGDNTAANMEKAEKAAKSYEAAIRNLKTTQGDLGSVMGRIVDREALGSVEQMRAELALLAKEQISARKALADNLVNAGTPGMFEGILDPLGPARELFRMGQDKTSQGTFGYLAAEFEAGRRSAVSLRDEVRKILLDDDLPSDLRAIGEAMLVGANQAAEIEARIKAVTTAIREQKQEIANDNYKAAVGGFDQFLPNNRTQREQIEQAYRERLAAIQSLQDNPRAMEGRRNTADAQRLTALKELDRQEEVLRQGRDLDIAAIGAQTLAERALLASQRERLRISEPGVNKEQVERDAVAASTLVYAQAETDAAEALRQANTAREQAGLDGYAAEVAAINANYAEQIRLAEGSASAVRDLTAARDAELVTLDVSTRKSLVGDQEEQIRLLQAEVGLIGLNDDARRVALATLEAEADLRRQGIGLNTEWGETYVANARQIASMENALDTQTEAFESLRDAADDFFSSISSGEGVLESLGSAFGKLASELATKGFDKIFGGLFGSGGQGNPAGGGLANAIAKVLVPTPRPAYNAPEQTFAAPVAAVERRVLPALSSFSTELNAAAKAIRTIESGSAGGNYAALGPITRTGDRAYGAYQVMGNNIADWSRSAIGREVSKMEFLRSVELQDKIFEHRFGGYMQKYGPDGASRAWFAGEGGMRNYRAQDVVGTSVSGYGGRFGTLYKQHSGSPAPVSKSEYQRTIRDATASGVKDGVKATSYDLGGYDAASAGQRGVFGERGMAGFNVLGAGIGAFSNGYSSGSPLSGGIGGIFTGLGASQSIATAFPGLAGIAGPLGAVGGAALGIIGGILGKRAQRKAAHKQAAEQWQSIQPQYAEFDRSITGEGQGQLREWLTSTMGQFDQFVAVGAKAWKSGAAAIIAQTTATGTKIWAEFDRKLVEFREGFTDMLEDLSSGEGLGGAFAKGRAATKDLKKQIESMIDDVSIAFGSADIGVGVNASYTESAKQWEESRNRAVEQAKRAAGEYALSLLYTAETSSSVENAMDGFRGTAAGLQKILEKLGWTSEQAAIAIEDRLDQAISEMGKTFVDGFQRQINDLSDMGYLNDVTDLIKARDEALSDATLLGVDPSIVTKWFDLAAQDIVDGAELTGDAFADLVKAFPELSGVVKAFVDEAGDAADAIAQAFSQRASSRFETALRERGDAEAALRSEYERTVDRIAGINDFLSDLRLDDNLSTLDGKGQFDEAQRLYREMLFKANGGDLEAQDGLVGSAQDFLDQAKAYWGDSAAYGAVFDEVNATLKASASKMETELDVARRQASFLNDIADNTKGLSALVADFLAAQKTVDSAYDGVNGARIWGTMADQNKAIIKALSGVGIQYGGNFGGGQFLDWISQQSTAQRSIIQPIVDRIIAQFAGKGYALGGYTGAGGVNEIAGFAHKGEVVWSQENVRSWGGPAQVEAMRLGRVAPVAMPSMERAIRGEREASDRGSRAEIAGLRGDVAHLASAIDGLGALLGAKLDENNRRTAEIARPLSRAASGPRR